MTPLLSDARLARQASDGKRRAFAAIYERYHQDLYRFCLSIVGRPEDAQDALQNTMVKALRALPGEKREIQLRPWLYRVAHNESVDLLRRRREGAELDGAEAAAGAEIAEQVALRERLGRLLADMDELPVRQRSALVMRELAGLGYEQIGEAFETSASVARQTVYEARLGLRELEAGREMSCEEVTRQLSDADGRVARRRDIRAHLRACPDCRAFREAIDSRRHDLAALSPLPAAAAASILHGLAGGKVAAGTGLGSAAASAGAGAGKVAGTSVVAKAVATVAVTATVGVTAADRGGLIDAGLPGGGSQEGVIQTGAPSEPPDPSAGEGTAQSSPDAEADGGSGGDSKDGGGLGSGAPERADEPHKASKAPSSAKAGGAGGAPPDSLPEASRHGQETAAAHKANGTDNPGQTRRNASAKEGSSRGGKPKGQRGGSEKDRQPEHASKGAGKPKGPPAAAPAEKPSNVVSPPPKPKNTVEEGTAPTDEQAEGDETEASP